MNFVDEPEALLEYISTAKKLAKSNSEIFLDLSNVTLLTPDSVVFLLSQLRSKPLKGKMSGNKPKDAAAASLLEASCFFDFFRVSNLIKTPRRGLVITDDSNMVKEKTAKSLKDFGVTNTLNRSGKYPPIYESLLDLMQNTKDHADTKVKGKEKWIAHAYNDPKTKITHYSFVDLGVGIVKSLRSREDFAKRIMELRLSDHAMLQKVFLGEILSRTGDSKRGRGLPKMYRRFHNKRIKRLIVISNDTYLNFERKEYRPLGSHFEGTFVYWELHPVA